MVNKHRSKRTYNKERKDEKTIKLNDNQEVRQLLALFGLSLTGRMSPKFGLGYPMELTVYQDSAGPEKQFALPTLDNLSQHLGFVPNEEIDEIRALDIPDKYHIRLIEGTFKDGKGELSKYLAKVRPLLLERNIYLYTVPLGRFETSPVTGEFVKKRSARVLCALPISREVAEQYRYSQEQIRQFAPLLAWLIPQLVMYNKVKNADRLLIALDGWTALLTPQQNEQLCTSVKNHDRPVMSDRITQLLLL